MIRRRFLLISNSLAGRGEVRLVNDVTQALAAAGALVRHCSGSTVEMVLDEARRAVERGEVDAVLAAGGDGTIRVAAKAVAGSGVALGAIPLGTGNVLAHEVGLPRSATALAHQFLFNPARKIFTATVNGELFLLMVGVGFDGRVISRLDHGVKQRLGKFAYIAPSLKAFVEPAHPLRVVTDGQSFEASWVIVTNAQRYGGRFLLTRRTNVESDGLVALLFHGSRKALRLRQLWAIGRGNLDRFARSPDAGCSIMPVREVTITADKPSPVQVDGDAFGTTPIRIGGPGPEVLFIFPARGA